MNMYDFTSGKQGFDMFKPKDIPEASDNPEDELTLADAPPKPIVQNENNKKSDPH